MINHSAAWLVVVCGLSLNVVAAEDAAQVQADLAALDQAIASIQSWMDEANSQQPDYEQRLREAEVSLAEQQVAFAETQAAIGFLTSDLEALQLSIADLDKQRIEQQAWVAKALYSAYVSGPQGQIKVLLTQDDASRTPRLLQYYQSFATARLDQLQRYQQTLTTLADSREQLHVTQDRLLTRQQEIDARRIELEATRVARQKALDELADAILSQGQELEALLADRRELEALIDRIEDAVEQIPSEPAIPFAQLQGQLPWPAGGRLISDFGSTYGDGSLRRQGIIIAGSAGSPVHAVHGGRIVFADWLRGYGLMAIIDHGDGYMSLYGYNQRLARQPGSWINGGELVAESGDSGGQDSAGIYFEIRHNGRPVNPLDWFLPASP